jgi:hypothetical protein
MVTFYQPDPRTTGVVRRYLEGKVQLIHLHKNKTA